MQIFLSHSSENFKAAQEVCAIIEKEGYKCFLAPRDIRSGHEYAEEIIDGIDSSDVMLLLLSEQSNSSPHVLREVERAVSKKIPIVVYELEKVKLSKSMEYFLMTHQWVDSKTDKGYKSILSCLSGFAEKAADDKQEAVLVDAGEPNAYDIAHTDAKPDRTKMISVIVAAASLVMLVLGAILVINLLSVADATITSLEAQGSQTTSASESSTTVGSSRQTTTSASTAATTSETTVQTTTSATSEEVPVITEPAVKIELGDTITLGTYNGAPIKWRVIKLADDNKSAVVLANNILTMKCFDAAESGTYNHYLNEDYWTADTSDFDDLMMRLLRGDNRWEYSNIRTWLNSEREIVEYADQAPTYDAMSENKNSYDDEAGFLHDFTDEELAAVLTTSVETNGVVTEDRVFMLSEEELQWLYEADVSKYAVPTPEAVQQDDSNWYAIELNDGGEESYLWWLRTTVEGSACNAYAVSSSRYEGRLVEHIVGAEGFGIRPAMTIDLTSDAFTVE